jgi:hypothetical protein
MKKREMNCVFNEYFIMTPQSLRKTHFSQNRQLYTLFTLQIRPEILIYCTFKKEWRC